MSAAELDVPLLPSAEQIRRRMFATVRRGFDPDQVRDYLLQVAEQVDDLEGQVREARLEVEAAFRPSTPQRDPYEELAGRLAELLRVADREAEAIRQEAMADAERMVTEARADADRIRVDAQSTAEEARHRGANTLRQAREEADRTLAGLASRRETLVEQLQSMQDRLMTVAKDLGAAIERPAHVQEEREISSPPGAGAGEEPLDPRYEDLWAGRGLDFDVPEIPTLDLTQGADEEDPADRLD